MAENNSTNRWRHFVHFLAYIAVIMIGIALALSFILSKVGVSSSIVGSISKVANALAYLIVCVASFYYARSKRNVWFFVLWLIATVLIVVFMVL